jgi:uncharacterized protein YkwD
VPSRTGICAVLFAASYLLVATVSAEAAVLSPREEAVVELINDVREAHRLPALSVGPRLTRAARAHSQAMLEQGVFTHGAFGERVRSFGVRFPLLGETIAWGTGWFGTPHGIVNGWLESPPHRALILDARFRVVGVGSRVGAFAGYERAAVVTADFGG